LGKTRLRVSSVSIGAEHLKRVPADVVEQIVDGAIGAGVNYFDLVWLLPNIMKGFQQALSGQSKKVVLAFHLGILALAKRLKSKGVAEAIAVSMHDPEVVQQAASTGIVDGAMYQVNLANHRYEAR
jgi:aryl-alcohol dehydrogenase-like predicted oxidoreductase